MDERRHYRLSDAQIEALSARVVAVLRSHRGSANAITGGQMARMLGQRNDRAIRVCIQRLIEQGVMIAASVHAPMGFYLIETAEEAEEYERTLRSRAVQTLKRLKDFRTAAARRFGAVGWEQGELFGERVIRKEEEEAINGREIQRP